MGEVHTKNTLKKNPFFVVLPSPAVIAAVVTAFPWLSPRRRNVSLDVSTEPPGPLYHDEHFFSLFPRQFRRADLNCADPLRSPPATTQGPLGAMRRFSSKLIGLFFPLPRPRRASAACNNCQLCAFAPGMISPPPEPVLAGMRNCEPINNSEIPPSLPADPPRRRDPPSRPTPPRSQPPRQTPATAFTRSS